MEPNFFSPEIPILIMSARALRLKFLARMMRKLRDLQLALAISVFSHLSVVIKDEIIALSRILSSC